MRHNRRRQLAWLLLLLPPLPQAGDAPVTRTFEKAATVSSLFTAEQAATLADVLPVDQQIRWQLHVPAPRETAPGVLIFVSPDASGEPQPGWTEVLDDRNLIWIAAKDFGNPVPGRKRVLAALLGLELVQQTYRIDPQRIYVAGMSGGGRVASLLATKFPRYFAGALYLVGVDFWSPAEQAAIADIAANRYVFLTGERDFNRRETRLVYRKYLEAGATQSLLMDLRRFGHEYPDARRFAEALTFLDARPPAAP